MRAQLELLVCARMWLVPRVCMAWQIIMRNNFVRMRFWGAILVVFAQAGICTAGETGFKKIEILESSGLPTTIRVQRGQNLFLSSRGDNPNCHNSGIEAVLNKTIRYVVHCKNDSKKDAGMKSVSTATYDGVHLTINSRSELNNIYFNHIWNIQITNSTCTGGVQIESTFGNFVKTISQCRVYY